MTLARIAFVVLITIAALVSAANLAAVHWAIGVVLYVLPILAFDAAIRWAKQERTAR
ncbi:hypothetical protein J4U01_gp083 [Mycobacterium phage Kumao]|uniref:Uncharacterized protein n=1 Tax=Mycobacterium phage Kumao TaxID=2041344 RepID=A0A2D1GQ32_9CAUD|nr:hypothetical protein J4U01_gp083 [Mycobacterium phage Kumao]ATN94075.1 hypothetical protein SEA_KUMAO_113 [Mycobacterium phage Kumao]